MIAGSDTPPPGEGRPLLYRYLGRRPYLPTWQLQNELARRLQGDEPRAREVFLTLEHDPVITIGRRGRATDVLLPSEELARAGIELHTVDRGGEVTYHGPGQLVLYPIVRVDPRRFGVGDLVRGLAASISDVLAELRVPASYDTDNPGLWVGDAKICAVGMRVSRGVSTHGAALNVTTDLEAFRWIVPCGMPEGPVTSLTQAMGPNRSPPPLPDLARAVAHRFAARFGFGIETISEPEWRALVRG